MTEEEALVPGSVKGSPQLYLTRLETLGPLSGLAVTQAAHLKAKINIHYLGTGIRCERHSTILKTYFCCF